MRNFLQLKNLFAMLALFALAQTALFADEGLTTVQITKIDSSKGVQFNKKIDGFKNVTVVTGKKTSAPNPISIDLSKFAGNSVLIKISGSIKIDGLGQDKSKIAWIVNDFASGMPEISSCTVQNGKWTNFSGEKMINLEGKRNLYIPGNAFDTKNAVVYIKDLNVTVTSDDADSANAKDWLSVPSLKDALAPYFDYFGLAVSWEGEFANKKVQEGVRYHADSITMGNEFKPDFIFRWNVPKSLKDWTGENGKTIKVPATKLAGFAVCDKILASAKANNLTMRGHVLVWHSQTPHWFFTENYSANANAKLVDKETMNARMEWYIKTVLDYVADWEQKHNDGKRIITTWDVVNEACSDNATADAYLRTDSDWYRVYGNDEFIVNAFRYANKYAPKDVALYYNDYNCYAGSNLSSGGKTNAVLKVLDAIKSAKDARIDGIGMQSHVQIDYPAVTGKTSDSFESALQKFIARGVDVQVTELDIANGKAPYSALKLKERYKDYIALCIKYRKTASKNGVAGVTIWGIKDDATWLNALEQYRGNTQYPLLFNKDFTCKPAFFGIIEAVNEAK